MTPAVERLLALALEEDLGRGDVTSEAIFDVKAPAAGRMMAKEPLVVCGQFLARAVFARIDGSTRYDPVLRDGERAEVGQTVAEVSGTARSVLAGERIALNFLQRLSGIATLTRQFVDAVEAVPGARTRICDTRKTAPGWRPLDKLAVRAGGGHNHRVDLASGVLIKDNHIIACGSVTAAIERARAHASHGLRIEVEVTSMPQIDEALAARADIILLDNMSPAMIKEAVGRIGGRALTEVSGGVRLDNVRAYAEAGPDLISIGALTHSARAVDLSLEL